MTKRQFDITDYPLAETQPGQVEGGTGVTLDGLTLKQVVSGALTISDFRITPATLEKQAAIARDAGRSTLSGNLARAAEMTALPQDLIMEVYELLRPGRAKSEDELLAVARQLRDMHRAPLLADFVEEAAEIYRRRKLYVGRF